MSKTKRHQNSDTRKTFSLIYLQKKYYHVDTHVDSNDEEVVIIDNNDVAMHGTTNKQEKDG